MVDIRIIWCQFDGSGIVRQGAIPVVFALSGVAATIVIIRRPWFEFNGFGIGGDGAVPVTRALPGVAELV